MNGKWNKLDTVTTETPYNLKLLNYVRMISGSQEKFIVAMNSPAGMTRQILSEIINGRRHPIDKERRWICETIQRAMRGKTYEDIENDVFPVCKSCGRR